MYYSYQSRDQSHEAISLIHKISLATLSKVIVAIFYITSSI